MTDTPPTVCAIAVDASGVVVSDYQGNCPPSTMTQVGDGVFAVVRSYGVGRCRFDGTAVSAYTPPPVVPSAPRTASAKQVRYALNDLGVRSAWNTAVMAAPQGDQDYWTSADPMFEANAKIAKWCKAAGITPKQLFDQAMTE